MKSVTGWFKRLPSTEHRKAQRMKAPLLVAFYWNGSAPIAHEVQNISSTGFYLLTTERWLPGTMVTMTLQRTDIANSARAEPHIPVLSKVIRQDKDGVGFSFVPLDEQPGSLNSRPVGQKTLDRFLGQVKRDRSHAIFRHIEAMLKKKVSGMHSGSTIPWKGDRFAD